MTDETRAEAERVLGEMLSQVQSLLDDATILEHGTFCNIRDGYPCSCGLDAFKAKLQGFGDYIPCKHGRIEA